MKLFRLIIILSTVNFFIVSCFSPEADLKRALKINSIESFRKFIKKNENNTAIREQAVDELTNQSIISMFAIEDNAFYLRKRAFEKITDQRELANIVLKGKEPLIIEYAWKKLVNQEVLMHLVDTLSFAKSRIRAVYGINNEDFLLKISRLDISEAVRLAAVVQMKSNESLMNVACTSYYSDLRRVAKSRINDSKLASRIDLTEIPIKKKLDEIEDEKNQKTLADISLKSDYDMLSLAACRKIDSQKTLANIVIKSTDRNVAIAALNKINDKVELEEVFNRANDNIIKLVVSVRLNKKSLSEIFSEIADPDKISDNWDTPMTVISILSSQSDIKNLVNETCRELIQRANQSRIPELIDLLYRYGDVQLAEDYLNCGQIQLCAAAETWCRNQKLTITTKPGHKDIHWGSGM